jgi:hypothetical protein
MSGTGIPSFEAPPGANIPGQFTAYPYPSTPVLINIPEFGRWYLESHGVEVKDQDAIDRTLPADVRFDAQAIADTHDQDSTREFNMGPRPGDDDRGRDDEGDIRPGTQIA